MIRRLVEQNEAGAADMGETLWTLLAAEVWYQDVYLVRAAPPPAMAATA
jgi:hypothetical protein